MDLAELQKQIGVDLAKDADDLEPVKGEYDFEMFTRTADGSGDLLKAFIEKDDETGEDEFYIKGIASSTVKDLHGDTILPSALIDMERQANDNLTILLNHQGRAPEDIGGQVVKASIQSSATDPETGAPIYDLAFEKIRIAKENPRAVQTFRSMQPKGKHPGVKLGLSIGARIPEGGAIRNKKTGALLISHVQLLETSIVTMPANPRSWIENAVKSLTTPRTATATVTSSVGGDTAVVTDLHITQQAPTPPTPPTPTPPAPEPPAPEITDSVPSQGAPESEPEADGDAATTPVTAAATPDPETTTSDPLVTPELRAALTEVHAALADVTAQLIDARQAQAEAEQRATRAESERDTVKLMAQDIIRDTQQIIDRLGRLPVGQKASYKAIKRDFDELPAGLDQIYSPEFLNTLRKGQET